MEFFFYICRVVILVHCRGVNVKCEPMKKSSFFYRVFDLYYEGVKNMTIGKTLWTVIAIKLFIIFVVIKLLFFPDFIKSRAEKGHEADFVGQEMVERAHD